MDRRLFIRREWLAGILSFILCLALVSSIVAPAATGSASADDEGLTYPIMRPDQETLKEWIESYNTAPRAYIDREAFQVPSPRGSQNILSHLDYDAATRNQGTCGNCWAWAGTGCLGIALDVQEGIKDRLSMQYINSCKSTGNYACCGGCLSDLADFYTGTGQCIPWSNTNASWQDGSKQCSDGSSDVSCGSIFTTPNYPITSINDSTITTQTVDQATAIANIKHQLNNNNKAVWFGFFLPDSSAWSDFQSFWNNNGEDVVYDMDQFCNTPYNSAPGEGGGHAVLCVGYNDDNPANKYWIMLNSWGTGPTTNRPNGLFRIDMDMAYDGQNSGLGGGDYSFYWQILDVTFGITVPDITISPPSFEVTLPPDTIWNDTLTIGNVGVAALTYDISDEETTGVTAPGLVQAPELPRGEKEGQLELIELSPSEPISFAETPLPFGGAQEEIAYDDGSAETAYYWLGVGGMFAVRFTPSSYPVSLETVRVCLWDSWPDSNHEQFGVEVYDDDGTGGEPGTLLGSLTTTATNWGWWDVDISGLGITITEGDFYIAYKQLTDSGGDCEGLCADETAPDGRSWAWDGASWLTVEDKGFGQLDWMIRCVVEKADCGWLSENPTSGSVAPGNSDDITVSIDTAGLAEGDYTANIVIANNDPDEDPTIVPVTLHVVSKPDLIVSQKYEEWVDFEEKAYNITYTVKNQGDAAAGASTTRIYIDSGSYDEYYDCPALDPDASYSNTVGPYTMSGDSDTIRVYADVYTAVAESNEDNNWLRNEFTICYDIDLVVGWNLISLPLIPDSTDITDIIRAENLASGNLDNVSLVYYFDTASGTWLWWNGSPASILTTMEDGLGYWMLMNVADTLTVQGTQVGEPPPEYGVIVGWNMIGLTSTAAMAPEVYLASVAGDYTLLYGWDAVGGTWLWWNGSPASTLTTMEPGDGYWILMDNPGTITPP